MASRDWPEAVPELLGRCTFADGPEVTCAVSGGPDSLALLALAVAAGRRVTAVHVDHGLRPESSREAAVVAAAAERFGAAFRPVKVEVAEGSNVEARARAARFEVLPDDVATGHTVDDQAETILYHVLRGSGLDGLSGMRSGPHHPILGLRRSETHALCATLGLRPVVDPSNTDPRHLRNRIRHELIPLCQEIGQRDPAALLARQAALLRDEADTLEALAIKAVPDPCDVGRLRTVPRALARRAVRRWLRLSGATETAGGRREGEDAQDRHPPTLADVDRVLQVARGEMVATEVSGGHRVRRSKGRLFLVPRTDLAKAATPKAPSAKAPSDGSLYPSVSSDPRWLGRHAVS